MREDDCMKRVLPLFLIFIIMSLFLATPVFADIELCPICGDYHASFFKEDAGEMAYNMCKIVYGNDKGSMSDLLDDVSKLDVNNAGSGFNMTTLWNTIGVIYNQLMVVGIVLVMVHFAMELMDHLQTEQVNPEKIAMMFIKLVLSILVISHGFEILTIFAMFANVIYDYVAAGNINITSTLNAEKCNYAAMSKAGVFDALGEILFLAIPWLICQGTNVMIMVLCYVRVIEIGAVAMFAPIGMSDIGFKGQHGSGWKYLKKLFALFLQGAVIMVMQMTFGLLNALVSGNVITTCVLNVVMVIAIWKSQSLANDVAGVR